MESLELTERELKICRYYARKYCRINLELRDFEDTFQEACVAALEVKLSGREVGPQSLRWKLLNNTRKTDGVYGGSRYLMRAATKKTFGVSVRDEGGLGDAYDAISTFDATPDFVEYEEKEAKAKELSVVDEALSLAPSERWATAARMRIQGKTLAEIGAKLGVTRERSRQLYEKAKEYLAKVIVDGKLDLAAVAKARETYALGFQTKKPKV